MDPANPNRADVGDVDEYPPWTARGEKNIRVRSLSTRHRKLLSLLEADLDDEAGAGRTVGHREAVAALLEFYYENPDRVVGGVTGGEFR